MNSHSPNQQGLKGKDIQDILIWFRIGFWWSPWIFRGLFLILLQDYLPFQTVRASYMSTVVPLKYNRFPKQFTIKSHNRNTIDSHKIVSWWFMGYFWNAQFLFPRIWVPSSISGTVRFWIPLPGADLVLCPAWFSQSGVVWLINLSVRHYFLSSVVTQFGGSHIFLSVAIRHESLSVRHDLSKTEILQNPHHPFPPLFKSKTRTLPNPSCPPFSPWTSKQGSYTSSSISSL